MKGFGAFAISDALRPESLHDVLEDPFESLEETIHVRVGPVVGGPQGNELARMEEHVEGEYDYRIVNDKLEDSLAQLENILFGESKQEKKSPSNE